MGKKYEITEELLRSCIEQNMTQIEIAQLLGCSKTLVRVYLKEFGIQSVNRRTKPTLDKDLLIRENYENKLTLKQIAKKYDRTYVSIKHMFKKFDIKPINNVVHKNQEKREGLFKKYDVTSLYGQLTKIEIQKKLGVGQEYLDQVLGDTPKPFMLQSSYEREMSEFIASLIPDITIDTNRRDLISPKEVDIYVPSHKLAIEIHGLYWHSLVHKEKKYHKDKVDACENKNITLLQFFEDEWVNKKDICKSILLSHLNRCTKLHARKCVIVAPTTSVCRKFFDDNHLQGFTNSSKCYALEYNNEIVCMMSFGKNRFGDGWELIRFCNKLNHSVVGGASKLLKKFISETRPQKLISYADRRISSGRLYKNLNFSFVKNTDVGYSYIVGKTRSNRMNWQKHKLEKKLPVFDPNKTEIENMIENKMFPIYDAGHKLFVWETWT